MTFTIDIDFDEASRSWMSNKLSIGNGSYKYICGAITKKGDKCKNHTNCRLHKKQQNNKTTKQQNNKTT
jgi:hypothetical protein